MSRTEAKDCQLEAERDRCVKIVEAAFINHQPGDTGILDGIIAKIRSGE